MTDAVVKLKEQFGDHDDLRQHLAGYLADNGLSQERAGKEAGISGSALNQWMKGKYQGDNEAVAEKILIWMASRERRSVAIQGFGKQGFIETATAQKIMNVLAFAQSAGDLSVIYGGAGVGKTTAIRHYATDNPNVWVITMRPDTASVASCLEEIGDVIGVRTGSRANRVSRDICRRLEDTGGLLVIDEAQHLTVPAIESIRSIHDATEIGLVLSGNETVYARLSGGTRSASFAQLFSRVGKRLRLTKSEKEDVASLASRYGITGGKELSTLIGISRKPGALRGVVKTLRLAVMFAGDIAPTQEHINAAWRDLGGEA